MFKTIWQFIRKHYLIAALSAFFVFLLVAFVAIEHGLQFGEQGGDKFPLLVLQAVATAFGLGAVIAIIEELAGAQKEENLINRLSSMLQENLELHLIHGFRQMHPSVEEIDRINDVKSGEIFWANTIIRRQEDSWDAIRDALERGVNVHLLLMHQDNKSRAYRARYTSEDPDDKKNKKRNLKRYITNLERQQSNLLSNYQDYQAAKKTGDLQGDLQIRFYKDPPGLPLFIVRGDDFVRAFSGFYLDSFSGALPYIEWTPRPDGSGVVKNLCNFFEKKWQFAGAGDAELLLRDDANNQSTRG